MKSILPSRKNYSLPLYFASTLHPPSAAEKQQSTHAKREPAYLSKEDFHWDDEKAVWRRLANAIIIQAKEDWTEASLRLDQDPTDEEAAALKEDTESFFLSDYYLLLTGYDGKTLLHRLQRERMK